MPIIYQGIITSCAADGGTVVVGKKNGCLKFMKYENTEMLLLHSVINEKNSIKDISPVLDDLLKYVIKCIDAIKAGAKCECLFKKFCEGRNAENVRLICLSVVRWISKVNCLKRFMELFDVHSDFLSDKLEMMSLLTAHCNGFVSYFGRYLWKTEYF